MSNILKFNDNPFILVQIEAIWMWITCGPSWLVLRTTQYMPRWKFWNGLTVQELWLPKNAAYSIQDDSYKTVDVNRLFVLLI